MNTVKEAIETIDTTKEGIPFEAIEFLYNHESTPEIMKKIIFSLDNAYNDDVYYDPEEDRQWNTPLWYAIVAENHLSEALIDPVIGLYFTTDPDWDYMNEQGLFLIGKLAQKYPDEVAEKVISTLEKHLDSKSKEDYPYLFLFDFLYYIDAERYQNRLLKILAHKNLEYADMFAVHMADLQIKEAIPIIKEKLKHKDIHFITRNEFEYALKKLETGKDKDEEYAKPYAETRGPWKEYYEGFEKIFYDDYVPEPSPLQQASQQLHTPPTQSSKIGRNDKVSVQYENGAIKRDIKFKKVEADLTEGKCRLID